MRQVGGGGRVPGGSEAIDVGLDKGGPSIDAANDHGAGRRRAIILDHASKHRAPRRLGGGSCSGSGGPGDPLADGHEIGRVGLVGRGAAALRPWSFRPLKHRLAADDPAWWRS